MEEIKKILISILIVSAFLFNMESYSIVREATGYSWGTNRLLFTLYRYLVFAPLSFLTIYIYYTLRRRLVFRILIYLTISIFIIGFIRGIVGLYSDTLVIDQLFDLLVSVGVFVILALVAIATKEKVLTILFLCFGVFPTFLLANFISNNFFIINFSISEAYVVIKIIGLTLLLVIYNKDKPIERKYNI